jgi:putative ABC transport system permease protein
MIIKLAWRNLIKNLRRSLVTIILGALCCGLMVFYESWRVGSWSKMLDDSVAMYPGYLQIHGKNYQDHPNYDNLIYNVGEVETAVAQLKKDIAGQTVRLETFALYSGNADAVGGMLTGIVPSSEANLSRLKDALKTGRFLEDSDENAVYLGVDLAKKLKVALGDEIVLISSAIDLSMAATQVKVVGTFQTSLPEFDGRAGFINKKFMDQEFLAENIASHIVILPKNKDKTFVLQKKLAKILNKDAYEVVSWKESMKDMVNFMEMDNVFDHLSFGILLIIVFFVIMIFSLIAIFQRTREIGIMRAVGMTQTQIFQILVVEMVILALFCALIGTILGSGLAYYFQIHPMQLKLDPEVMEMYRQWGIYDLTFPAKLNLTTVLMGAVPVFFLIILAVLYPAWKINQMRPIDAIEGR